MITLILDSAWKATPVLAAAWVATVLMRRGAADVRHRVWLAAIGVVALLPAALWIAPAAIPESARIVVSATAAGAAARVAQFPWMLAVWMMGMGAVLARLGIGIWAVARVGNDSERIQTPMTWGVFRPVILLPAYMRAWSEDQKAAVLRHERAHIERRDWLWQTMARVVTAVFWFHPLVWLADAALRREAERAADDRVLSAGTAAVDYAAQLLDVARRIGAPAAMNAAAVAIARERKLEGRVREILDGTRNRSRAGAAATMAIALTAAGLLLPLAAIGQDETVHKIGEAGLKAPRVLNKVEPEYTPAARDAKVEGTTVLQMVIDEQGKAQKITVTRSLDTGLDQSAVDAVRQWTFAPAMKNGQPVRCAATIEVNFHVK